jgi:predicted Rossmann-fold nucleotide-binding protein
MGIVSDAVLDAGGKTIGVIPRAMITKGGEGEDLIPGAEPSKPDADNVKFTLIRKFLRS